MYEALKTFLIINMRPLDRSTLNCVPLSMQRIVALTLHERHDELEMMLITIADRIKISLHQV